MTGFTPPAMPSAAKARIEWFIRLRWLAMLGVLLFALGGRVVFDFEMWLAPFVIIAVGMAAYNTVFLLYSRRMQRRQAERTEGSRFAGLQVGVDILMLTILVHYGGGIENPFIAFYMFHTIIAAILLPWKYVIVQVMVATLCLGGLAIGEHVGLLPHYHVNGFMSVELYSNWKFMIVILVVFATTLCGSAVLAASIAERLRQHETELAEANKMLRAQDRTKSRYVMRVAHDLAEPAGMITSCLSVVIQGLSGPVSEKALDMIQRAHGKSEYLGHLIKDLLSLSRIKATKHIPKTTIELEGIIKQVFEETWLRAAKKDVTLALNLPSTIRPVCGNADAVYELFANLVTNAVKYTLLGGSVNVSASNNGQEVRINVQDDGVGIPADDLPHIFEEFYRADNVKAEAVEGTGLGLSIVSQILKAHDGRIWLESEEGKGTTFSFTLPCIGEHHDR